MEDNRLQRIQEINRNILNEVARVCNKYNICYYLDCGALLGAVRHKSFIPWDDDIDISFTRGNYKKFVEAVQVEWKDTNYLLHKPEDFTDNKWLDYTIRIVKTDEIVELHSYDKVGEDAAKAVWNHPGIDIFILDDIPDNPKYQKRLTWLLTLDYGMAMGHRKYIDYAEYAGIQKIIIWILSHIGKLFSVKTLMKRYNAHCSKYENCDGRYYFYSNFSLKDIKKRNERAWYQEGTTVYIDEVPYNAPVNYHEVLRMNYGDYMKLPPEAERVAKHL